MYPDGSSYYSNGNHSISIKEIEGTDLQFEICNSDGDKNAFLNSKRSIIEALAEWEWRDMGYTYFPEWLAAWGINVEVKAAEENNEGPFAIWCEYHYYPGYYNAPTNKLLYDDNNEPIVFELYEDAQTYVNNFYSLESIYNGITQRNCLSYGQYSGNDLKVVTL